MIVVLTLASIALAIVAAGFRQLSLTAMRQAREAWKAVTDLRQGAYKEAHKERRRANHHRERCRALRRKLREIENGEGGGNVQ